MLTINSRPTNLLNLIIVVLFFLLLPANTYGQQKRATRNQAKAPVTNPPPTFDTLLAADTYQVYGEVRGVGQLIQSSSVKELLEPLMKLAAPPRELTTIIRWLNTHADAVSTSRMLVAGWPTVPNVPEVLVAIEFTSAEEAAKFDPQLNNFLSRVLPPSAAQPSPSPAANATQTEASKPVPLKPNFYLKQVGSLLLITPTPLVLKNLRPSTSKLLAEDTNFRTAHDRFSSESVFVFVDMKGIEKERQKQREQYQQEALKRESEAAASPTPNEDAQTTKPPESGQDEPPAPEPPPPPVVIEQQPAETIAQPSSTPAPPDMMATLLSVTSSSFFGAPTRWPEAIGIALSFDNDSFDARALLVSSPGEKSDAVPLFPLFIPGPSLVPESPSILPADTEMFVTMSLDLQQVYARMNKRNRSQSSQVIGQTVNETEEQAPFAPVEKKLGLKIKDDVLPLLGNEVVFSMSVKELEPNAAPSPTSNETNAEKQAATRASSTIPSPVIALSLRDKEGMRTLLPKLIDRLGFSGASTLAQTERRGDTELVSYANVFAYAFVGNFLILSADPASTRHVVDCYLKNETLASDVNFKNYTRWQPRQLQAQAYISPALMESYKSWANGPEALVSEQARELLLRLSVIPQPVTYSLSNDGLGTLHELHIPRNLVLLAVAGMSGAVEPPATVRNEAKARFSMQWLANAEEQFRAGSKNGPYGTLEELIAAKLITKEALENFGYRIDLTASGATFEATAVPTEYGTTGKISYFVDQSGIVRAGDHGGGPATVADKPAQ